MKGFNLNSWRANSRNLDDSVGILIIEIEVTIMSREDISAAVNKRVCSLSGRRWQAIEVNENKTRAIKDCAEEITRINNGEIIQKKEVRIKWNKIITCRSSR